MRRKRRVFPLTISFFILALVFGLIGFATAYYRYSGQIAKEKIERQQEQELLQALIKAQEDSSCNINKNNEIIAANYNDTINNETQLIYKTLYAQCEDTIEEIQNATSELIGLNEDGFKEYLTENQLDWEIESFSKERIVLSKQVDTICPNYYLVSVNNGCIAIYRYDENNNRRLIEQTDIPINILPIIDQEKLQKGVLLETMDEVNRLLEDYSS